MMERTKSYGPWTILVINKIILYFQNLSSSLAKMSCTHINHMSDEDVKVTTKTCLKKRFLSAKIIFKYFFPNCNFFPEKYCKRNFE